jgi:FtsP/CotA-like multicopper oxidase with cupredoxin domain
MKLEITRKDFLKLGGAALVGAASAGAITRETTSAHPSKPIPLIQHSGELGPGLIGEVDHISNGFNPSTLLSDFDYGKVSTLPSGRTLREFTIIAANQNIEVVPGIMFPAWTYNGRIPGPTIRCTEGDLLRIHFSNHSDHPHSMHFHGIHPANMDGVPGTGPGGSVGPGESFSYEFDALPFGIHLYHCHVFPLARHIAKGLYGAFIVDPKGGRPPVDHEMIMVMHGFDIDFDNKNDFYAVNGIPFHYQKHPIQVKVNQSVRIYLVNILEFDLINSFHLHANFFNYFPTGTSLSPAEYTDTIMQTQAQRGILEFSYAHPGKYMFHAHNTEFAELGWTGMFEVAP